MRDVTFKQSGRWALASDGLQWVLQRLGGGTWRAVSFVRSDREILERCMREKGTPLDDAVNLLEGLPQTFNEWWAVHEAEITQLAQNSLPGQINAIRKQAAE